MNAPGTEIQKPASSFGSERPRGLAKWVVATAVSIQAIRAVSDINLLGPVARFIAGSLSVPPAEMNTALHVYGPAAAVSFLLLVLGERRIGRKKLFLLALAAFILASVLCAVTPNLRMLLPFRVIQGLTAGGLIAGSVAILGELFAPIQPRNTVTLLFVLALGVGSLLGPTVGYYICDNFSWRWIFLVNFPLGIVVLILAALLLPKDSTSSPGRANLDWPTLAFSTVALASWTYVFTART